MAHPAHHHGDTSRRARRPRHHHHHPYPSSAASISNAGAYYDDGAFGDGGYAQQYDGYDAHAYYDGAYARDEGYARDTRSRAYYDDDYYAQEYHPQQPLYQTPQPFYAPQPFYQQPPFYQAPQPFYAAPQPFYQAPPPFYDAQPQGHQSFSSGQRARPYTTASSSSSSSSRRGAYQHLQPAPSHDPDTRPHPRSPVRRTPSPAPAPTPAPSPAYLALARTPSTPLPPGRAPRKLLILDLNGTLVLRAARAPRGPTPTLRRVHARPFLPALRAFLAQAHTRAWLDVMVWSSAQPHSVRDMVERAFGEDQAGLRAVWARDTLGLAGDSYHRKVQTIKDLEKPWRELFSPRAASPGIASSPASSPPRSSSPLPPSSQRTAADEHEEEQAQAPYEGHSARTTLLLDDSVRKAALQPYNHVCLREYTQAVRNRDLHVLAPPPPPEEEPAEAEEEVVGEEDDAEAEKKRRRKEKKMRKAAARRAAAAPESEHEDGETEVEGLDTTLLAVIGILDAVRAESNVAGWIYAGGLWGPYAHARGEKKGGDAPEGTGAGSDAGAPLWFEHAETVEYWTARGREVLGSMGIAAAHGLSVVA